MRRASMFGGTIAAAVLLAACTAASRADHPPHRGQSAPAAAPSSVSSGPTTDPGWPTYGHDAARSASAPTKQRAGKVHRLWRSRRLDGAVYAQPLVVGK